MGVTDSRCNINAIDEKAVFSCRSFVVPFGRGGCAAGSLLNFDEYAAFGKPAALPDTLPYDPDGIWTLNLKKSGNRAPMSTILSSRPVWSIRLTANTAMAAPTAIFIMWARRAARRAMGMPICRAKGCCWISRRHGRIPLRRGSSRR